MIFTDTSPLVSIIIINYNGKKYLTNCIASVLQTSYRNFEVILVDNGSTDCSLNVIKKNFGTDNRLRIVENPVNSGFSGGNNIGFEHCNGEFIAFLNNDTTVHCDWLTHLVNEMQRDETVGLAQSMILTIDGEKIQTAGWLYSDYLVLMHGLAKDKASDFKLMPIFEVPVASGTCMIVRRSLIKELGLFEPTVPFFYDDTLLSFKVWLANKKVVTIPASKIFHIGGATDIWNIRFASYNFLKAKLCLTFDIYHNIGELSFALFVNFFALSINSLFGLKKRNVNAILANINALMWGLRNFDFVWRNRLDHWSKTKVSPSYLREKFVRVSIPVPFYLLPSKLGSELFASEAYNYEKNFVNLSI